MQRISRDRVKRFVSSQRFTKPGETVIHYYHATSIDLNPDRIKVLNWNIAKNNYSLKWMEEFATLLSHHDPDIICLQEVRLDASTHSMIELAGRSWNFAPNFIDTYHNAYAGILTAARAHPKTKDLLLSQHFEPITQTPKISLFIEYPLWPGYTLLVVNTHLINFSERSPFQAQLQAIERRILQHPGAVIFSGDCNTWNLGRWQLLQEMATRLQLTQAHFSLQDSLKIKRFLFSPPLDYIFHRGLIEHRSTVLADYSTSDHKPMIVEFAGLK
jgi:endonuclease/exonuclease/phosphatase (EEP) superfamily protein YafD